MSYRIPPMGPNSYPGWQQNYIPSPGEWDAWWSSKADDFGITVSANTLKAMGAPMTGVSGDDDSVYVQKIIDTAVALAGTGQASIAFDFGAAKLWFSNTVYSRSANISLRGIGFEQCVISGESQTLWSHGTASTPTSGRFMSSGIQFCDSGKAAAQIAGLGFYWTASSIACGTFYMSGCWIRNFWRGIAANNMPRDFILPDGVISGPDGTMQTGDGIYFTNDTGECFNVQIGRVNIYNYQYGVTVLAQTHFEGVRFKGTTCYNGWGMYRYWVNPNANGSGIYQGVIHYITDCDWQGYGYFAELSYARNVVIERNYLNFNARGSLAIPDALDGTARTVIYGAAYFQYASCVLFDKNAIDVPGSSLTTSDYLVYCDANTTQFKAHSNIITAFQVLAGGFHWASRTSINECGEFNTTWNAWAASTTVKIVDDSSNQMSQSLIIDKGIGNVDEFGNWQLVYHGASVTTDSTGVARIWFPTREESGVAYSETGATYCDNAPWVDVNIYQAAAAINATVTVQAGTNRYVDVMLYGWELVSGALTQVPSAGVSFDPLVFLKGS